MTRADRRIKEDLAENRQNYSAEGKSIFTAAFLQEEATDWVKNLREFDEEGQALFPNQYLRIRYEDLLSNPYETLTRLWGSLQVASSFPEDRALIQGRLTRNRGAEEHARKESSLVENLKRGTAGGWQDWFTDADRQVFKETGGDSLIRWDYEKDLNW
jgi:hypothetical protein